MESKVKGSLRILDFDIENRPLTYLGQDFTTADITAIAASWVGEKKIEAWLLGECSIEEMLTNFTVLYDQADIVTGHYIRKHDLPIINGALFEAGMQTLSPKRVQDTKIDLVRRQGFSVSQESIAETFGLPVSKYHMSQPKWRAANRLTPEGLAQTRNRVTEDVRQHKLMLEDMISRKVLKAPQMWNPL